VAPEPAERRLAAILSADVVGYSRLMAEDEAATVRTLSDYREEIGVLVRQHRGRVHHAAAVLANQQPDLFAVVTEGANGRRLILHHEPAIADHIGR
jgi:class 3 adenylate cyclase